MLEGFSLRRGDTYDWSLTFDDGGDPAVPIDISGKTFTFTVKDSYSDADTDAIIQVSTVFPTSQNSQQGLGSIFIPHSQTVNLVPGNKVYYDFQLAWYVDTTLKVITLAAGTFKVAWDVTLTTP